ncbi:VOC family protein [Leptospira bouyouniensis]|uniref:VOC family protein n=1 Tax=Leptospira bouyouniensis TaxID=2484911 RepID=A0A7I0HUZ3_9LEPT|nr:VOC family protein [Leptospira bouyouniensis]TGL07988.1 VOC family protein [Leptospira bouyouniensis]
MAAPKKKKKTIAKKKSSITKVSSQTKNSQPITPFLMFNANLEEVTKFYSGIFKQSKVLSVNPMQAEFVLNGQKFSAYNGGPEFKFSWGVSFMIHVETQKEVDHYWNALSAGGKELMCGWVEDKFGMVWQITPNILLELISHKDPIKREKATQAMLKMRKIDIASLKEAIRN